jgi:membrane protein
VRRLTASDRDRVLRTLTFWLRPYFVLRVVNRFQRLVGFDRAIGLASSALTALIPLAMVVSVVSGQLGGRSTAERIIDRYDLTGGGAQAVRDVFSPAGGGQTSLGIIGVLFVLLAVLSFTRGAQRLVEGVWEIPALGVRNSANGLVWAAGLVVYLGVSGVVHGLLGGGPLEVIPTLLTVPLTCLFLVWTGWLLSAMRLGRDALGPFAVLGAAVLALYSVAADIYLPHLFSTSATRYGVIGAVFAMISALFAIMVLFVGSAVAGREIHVELQDIRAGRRPAEDEVHRQWEELLADGRSRWETGRSRLGRRRRG